MEAQDKRKKILDLLTQLFTKHQEETFSDFLQNTWMYMRGLNHSYTTPTPSFNFTDEQVIFFLEQELTDTYMVEVALTRYYRYENIQARSQIEAEDRARNAALSGAIPGSVRGVDRQIKDADARVIDVSKQKKK